MSFWAITTFFNPAGYRKKREHYLTFRSSLVRQKVNLFTVELAFGHQPFALDPEPNLLQIKTPDILWQKERLLNIALQELPADCDQVAWLDSDILFLNDDWARDTSKQLESHLLVQPYAEAMQFGSLHIGYIHSRSHQAFDVHCAMGLAWAGRRGLLLKHGLYDGAILGSADVYMVAAMFDKTPMMRSKLFGQPAPVPMNGPQQEHFFRWRGPFFRDVQGQVGSAPGKVVHLEHGQRDKRYYLERIQALADMGFDPFSDVAIGEDRCWHWTGTKPEIARFAREYFHMRNEDD